ncbi:3303_t:CDS:1, partial [Acaulospora colombiana]
LEAHILFHSKGMHVVPCRGITKDNDGDLMLVMDVMIEDLRSYIRREDLKMTWNQVYDILYSICERLSSIHSENSCHKDLHPANILRNSKKMWMISDFGLCGPPNMPPNCVYGVLPFIAPETLNSKIYSQASDIYSVGMLMYEVATGLPPFNEKRADVNLACHILDGNRPIVPNEFNFLSSKYTGIMNRCWDALPQNRPTATEVRDFFFGELVRYRENSGYGSEPIKNYGKGRSSTIDFYRSSIHSTHSIPVQSQEL